jgi:hypothetical protein
LYEQAFARVQRRKLMMVRRQCRDCVLDAEQLGYEVFKMG